MKKSVLGLELIFLVLAALFLRSCTSPSPPTSSITASPIPAPTAYNSAQWWNSNWKYRQKLLFNNKNQVEDLVNFPVLIHLTKQNFNFSLAKINGDDLRFIAQDGITVLPHEIEHWDVNSKTAVAWVNVPKIHALTNQDHIYLYYGNSGALNGEQKEKTWDDHFISVWHLSDYPANELVSSSVDSTVNKKTLSIVGLQNRVISTSSAMIGRTSVWFNNPINDGAKGYLKTSGKVSFYNFDENEDFSVSTWVKAEPRSEYLGILGNQSVDNPRAGWGFFTGYASQPPYSAGNYPVFSIQNECCASMGSLDRFVSVSDGDWHFLAGSRVGDTISFFHDGSLTQLDRRKVPLLYQWRSMSRSSYNFAMGQDAGPSGWFAYMGSIDETRVSRSGRSLSWFQAEYLNGLDQFVNYDDPNISVVVPDKKLSATDLNLDITFTTQKLPPNATTNAGTLVQVFSATPSATRTPLNFQGIIDNRATWKGTVKIPKIKMDQYQRFQGSVEFLKKNTPGIIPTHFTNLSADYTNLGSAFDFQVDLYTPATLRF